MSDASYPNLPPIQTKQFRRRISRSILLVLLPLTIIPVLLMGGGAYLRAYDLLQDQISLQLNSILEIQKKQIDGWTKRNWIRLRLATSRQAFILPLEKFFNEENNPGINFGETRQEILGTLFHFTQLDSQRSFNEFLILNQDGEVIFSSNEEWEGLRLNDTAYYPYLSGKNSAAFFAPFPLYTDELIVFSIQPFFDSQNNLRATILGISESNNILKNLQNAPLVHKAARSYYITQNNEFIGQDQFGARLIAIEPLSEQYTAITELSSTARYGNGGQDTPPVSVNMPSYDGEPVVASLAWMTTPGIGIVVEVPQEEVFGQLNSLGIFTILVLAVIVILLGLVSLLGTKIFVNPLIQVSDTIRAFTEGKWTARTTIDRDDEIGLLAFTFNQMANELTTLYTSLEDQVSERSEQIRTAAEVARIATSATELDDLLRRTVSLIIERFGYYQASIFLLDETHQYAVLQESYGEIGGKLKAEGFRLLVGSESIIGWVTANNRARIASEVDEDPSYFSHDLLPETRCELALPIAVGGLVLGALDVQSAKSNAFDPESVASLQTLADQIASTIQNIRLRQTAQVDLLEMTMLYRAGRDISVADSEERIYQAVTSTLQKSSYPSALYRAEQNGFKLLSAKSQKGQEFPEIGTWVETAPAALELQSVMEIPLLIVDSTTRTHISQEFRELAQQLGWQSVAYLPIQVAGQIDALIIFGEYEKSRFTYAALQPYAGLVELTSIALEKVHVRLAIQKRLAELQTLSSVSRIITYETDMDNLYELIFRQIQNIMGKVAFLIALYDSESNQVTIPFAQEKGENLIINPFPLGEGLISHVIRTRKPLMLLEDAAKQAQELGAQTIGLPSKSWLGVPLIVADEIIGVMSVQDVENEQRFNKDDLRLMSTLASQIAVVVRNARLIEEAQEGALQLKIAADISREMNRSLNLTELLQNAIGLICERFNYDHVSIYLVDNTTENLILNQSSNDVGYSFAKEGFQISIGSNSVIGTASAQRKPFVVSDMNKVAGFYSDPHIPEVRSQIGIPLIRGDELLGVLDIQSLRPNTFLTEEVKVLSILGDQLAVTIANAELFRRTRENLAKHRLLHQVTTVSAASTSVEEALRASASELSDSLSGDAVSIFLVNPAGMAFDLAASTGFMEKDLMDTRVPLGEGIIGWVGENRTVLRLDDANSDDRFQRKHPRIQSLIALPILYQSELLGVLTIASEEPAAYDVNDQEVFSTICGTLGAILANTRLIERQQLLYEVTSKIRRSTNMKDIMETTVTELSNVIGAQRASLRIGFDHATQNPANIPEQDGQSMPADGNSKSRA